MSPSRFKLTLQGIDALLLGNEVERKFFDFFQQGHVEGGGVYARPLVVVDTSVSILIDTLSVPVSLSFSADTPKTQLARPVVLVAVVRTTMLSWPLLLPLQNEQSRGRKYDDVFIVVGVD